jgi:phosphatidate cytidylyltransferase
VKDVGAEHRKMMTRQFKHRLLMSSLGTLILIFSIYYSSTSFFKPFFILLNAGIISIALLEYYQLTQRKGFKPLVTLGIGFSIAYILALALSFNHILLESLPSLVLLISLLLFFFMFFKQQSSSIGNLAVTLFGIVYLTIPLGCALRINYFYPSTDLADGRLWLAYVLIVSKMTDIGAYFCGKSFGRTKLAPMISPKKTVEGALGGTAASLITSILISLFFPFTTLAASFKITMMQSIWVGLLISILSQIGDLAESILKRDAGVKDSSDLPGLGGMLDIVDSLVFTLPLMYLLLQMHIVG